MIEQNKQNEQLPNEIKSVFNELNVIKHLYTAGINKSKGFSTSYLFILVFSLVFNGKNLFQYLES